MQILKLLVINDFSVSCTPPLETLLTDEKFENLGCDSGLPLKHSRREGRGRWHEAPSKGLDVNLTPNFATI